MNPLETSALAPRRTVKTPKVVMPIPERDFDPTEVAVSWRVLRDHGIQVRFATPHGQEGAADPLMLTGQGLDLWGRVPGLKRFPLLGLFLRANRQARQAYERLLGDPYFQSPFRYSDLNVAAFDGLLLPGGHCARGMREYLEDPMLQRFVAAFFASGKPVAAICHGVVLAARARHPVTGRSSLFGKKTTALPWKLENAAWELMHYFGRVWDPDYYRTYVEADSEPEGARSVETEVRRALAHDEDFIDVAPDAKHHFMKTSGFFRDTPFNARAAHVVVDDNYVSARWPGDVNTFAREFAALILRAVGKSEEEIALSTQRFFAATRRPFAAPVPEPEDIEAPASLS